MMPSHKNPAEHCRSINVGVGDKIRFPNGNEILVTYLGRDYIHAETGDIQPWTARVFHDITNGVKVEPKPVEGGHRLEVEENDRWLDDYVICFPDGQTCECNMATRITGETKAQSDARCRAAFQRAVDFLNDETSETAKVSEGPFESSTASPNGDHVVQRHHGPIVIRLVDVSTTLREYPVAEILARHAREIATELNRLHAAKTQPV